ncbi:MAG: tetratricopeptide repeat protein, partial [Bacteroidetes bacterium]|nr:tetratricopeptide repeat protein [Bacteroidota bacterium]
AMRELGVGPFGSLQASGALNLDATILVADFENSTSEAALSESVTELLRIALSQSSAIRLLESSDIASALIRMQRNPNDLVDINTGMEIAQREGVEGVVSGKISPIGSGYLLTASMFAAHDGSELVKLSQTARSADDIIDAVDRLSKELRERIGESIKSIRSNEDLDRVTTASLDALRLYSQGVAAEEVGDSPRAIELLHQAIERDSTFAMAYRKLAVVNSNANGRFDVTLRASKKAFELRARLPEVERMLAEANYYSVINDVERTVSAYEALLDRYPNNTIALNNVSISYQRMGRMEDAEKVLSRALEIGNRTVYYQNYFAVLTALKKWDEASKVLDRFEISFPNHPMASALRFHLAVLQGQFQNANTLISVAQKSSLPYWLAYDARLNAIWEGMTGKMNDSEDHARQVAKNETDRGEAGAGLLSFIWAANNALDIQEDPEKSKKLLAEGLRQIPFDSIPTLSRPYSEMAYLEARLGNLDAAKLYMDRFEKEIPSEVKQGDFIKFPARAFIELANGRSSEAVAILREGRKKLSCAACFLNEEGFLLAKMDSTEQALAVLERFQDNTWGFTNVFTGVDRPIAWLEMGELYSRTGQNKEAIEAYSNFIDLWAEADASLQPKVRYARSRVERLLDQSAREPSK